MRRRTVLTLLCGLWLAIAGATPAAGAGGEAVIIVGDSLSAGYGIRADEGWVALLEQRLRQHGHGMDVVNASISGDTSRGGRTRIDALLDRHTGGVVVVELGGNDGLRGLSLQETERNLEYIIERASAAGFRVLLVGMQLPPNLGPAYTQRFADIYPTLAERQGVALVPFLLEGVALRPELMQNDAIHPTAQAQPRMLDNVWPHLEALL